IVRPRGFCYGSGRAGVVQWQYRSFPSFGRGFDSHRPLQNTRTQVEEQSPPVLGPNPQGWATRLSQEEQKLVWATHYPAVFDSVHQQKLDDKNIGWKSKPTWYVLATKDHTVHPDLQRWVSKRMGAQLTEVESSHVPMLSLSQM